MEPLSDLDYSVMKSISDFIQRGRTLFQEVRGPELATEDLQYRLPIGSEKEPVRWILSTSQ